MWCIWKKRNVTSEFNKLIVFEYRLLWVEQGYLDIFPSSGHDKMTFKKYPPNFDVCSHLDMFELFSAI